MEHEIVIWKKPHLQVHLDVDDGAVQLRDRDDGMPFRIVLADIDWLIAKLRAAHLAGVTHGQ